MASVVVLLLGLALLPLAMTDRAAATDPGFSGYTTGANVHADVLTSGASRLVDAEVAFSGAAVDSKGLGSAVNNEMQLQVSPARSSKTSFARGSGLELGVGQSLPIAENPTILAGKAEADAPPNSQAERKQVGPVDLDPILFATLLRSDALANSGPGGCVLGPKDLANGQAFAEKVQLLDTAATDAEGLAEPLIATEAFEPERGVTNSTSRLRLIPQVNEQGVVIGPGIGLMSETYQTIAPVSIGDFTIEVLGLWRFRAVATGLPVPGGAWIHYGPVDDDPDTPILRIVDKKTGAESAKLSTQDLLGDGGLVVPLDGILEVAAGEDPRAINAPPDADSSPTESADGTTAAGAVDVVRVRLLQSATEPDQLVEARVGHFEAKAVVPPGGVRCDLDVKKTVPGSVRVGEPFTALIKVTNPYDCTVTE
ncbi:MAG: hypothetical protein ACRDJK_10185, partial [Actinomycetota bacterium]